MPITTPCGACIAEIALARAWANGSIPKWSSSGVVIGVSLVSMFCQVVIGFFDFHTWKWCLRANSFPGSTQISHGAGFSHLIETTARPFAPHPRHRNRPRRSSTFAAGLSPALEDLRRQQRASFARQSANKLGAHRIAPTMSQKLPCC